MEIIDINKKIKLTNLKIQVEDRFKIKQELKKQLKILEYKKEIEFIKIKIIDLSK